jgi:hypothetical protein
MSARQKTIYWKALERNCRKNNKILSLKGVMPISKIGSTRK